MKIPSIFDRFIPKKPAPQSRQDPETDELPNMIEDMSAETPRFRRRETAQAAEIVAQGGEHQSEVDAEVPPVNGKKPTNPAVRGAVIVSALIACLVMLYFATSGPAPKKAKATNENANGTGPKIDFSAIKAPQPQPLPGLSAEPTTPPASAPSLGGVQVPPGSSGAAPIAVRGGQTPPGQGGSSQTQPNGQPIPQHWTDRKMGGMVLVGQQNGSQSSGSPPAYQPPPSQGSGSSSGSFDAGGGRDNLATRLEPTIMQATSAAMLKNRNYLIAKGATLPCVLETAIDTTLPGIITCRLIRDVYSDNGQVVLLDRGSSLVGEYQNSIKQGQARVFVLWTRAKTPNGVAIAINSPGADELGRGGITGFVDNHFWERFGAAILMSIIKESLTIVAAKSAGDGTSGTTFNMGNTTQAGEKVVEKILDATVNIPPTIIINQGAELRVMVARDLDFSTVYDLKLQ